MSITCFFWGLQRRKLGRLSQRVTLTLESSKMKELQSHYLGLNTAVQTQEISCNLSIPTVSSQITSHSFIEKGTLFKIPRRGESVRAGLVRGTSLKSTIRNTVPLEDEEGSGVAIRLPDQNRTRRAIQNPTRFGERPGKSPCSGGGKAGEA